MFSPALEMSYAQSPAHTVIAHTLDMWTIDPRVGGSFLSMCGIAAWATRNGPRTLVARMRSNSATSHSATSDHSEASVPALEISRSRPPIASTAPATTSSAPSGLDTSPSASNASPLPVRICSTVFPVRSASRPPQATLAPSAAKRRATSRPMPLDAPVTSARLPERRPPLANKRLRILGREILLVKDSGGLGDRRVLRGQHHNSPGTARRRHRDRFVDLVESEAVRDQRSEVEHARHRQPRQLGDVQRGDRAAEV